MKFLTSAFLAFFLATIPLLAMADQGEGEIIDLSPTDAVCSVNVANEDEPYPLQILESFVVAAGKTPKEKIKSPRSIDMHTDENNKDPNKDKYVSRYYKVKDVPGYFLAEIHINKNYGFKNSYVSLRWLKEPIGLSKNYPPIYADASVQGIDLSIAGASLNIKQTANGVYAIAWIHCYPRPR